MALHDHHRRGAAKHGGEECESRSFDLGIRFGQRPHRHSTTMEVSWTLTHISNIFFSSAQIPKFTDSIHRVTLTTIVIQTNVWGDFQLCWGWSSATLAQVRQMGPRHILPRCPKYVY
jgi:hypothetical protein